MTKFERDQRVVLAREFTFHGESVAQNDSLLTVPVGTTGTCLEDWGNDTIVVHWDRPDEHQQDDEFAVDMACLEPENPVTEEELAEVYRILGVRN